MSERTLLRPTLHNRRVAHRRSSTPELVVDLRERRAATDRTPATTTSLSGATEVAGLPTSVELLARASERRPGASAVDARRELSVRTVDATVATAVAAAAVAVLWSQAVVPAAAVLLAPVLGALWVVCMSVARAYEERILWTGSAELHRVGIGAGLAAVVVLGAGWLGLPDAVAPWALAALGLTTVLTVGSRSLVRARAQAANRAGAVRVRVLAVGPAADVEAVTARISRNTYHGWSVVDTLALDDVSDRPRGLRHDHGPADVVARAAEARADVVLVCQGTSVADLHDLDRAQHDLEADGRELAIAPPLVEAVGPRVSVPTVCGLPIIRIANPELNGGRRVLKAVADRLVASVAVTLLLPFFAAVALAVRTTSRGPAFFTQKRVGLGGELFTMIKFRTMSVEAEAHKQALLEANEGAGPLFKMKDDPRITRVGAVLRRTSLDELPQLFNILRGDMSFVGPRPALATEVAQYDDVERRRLLVQPGLTGLWQIHGRSDLPWAETRRLDVRYVENWSLGFDLSILTRTVGAVLRARGAY